jgi:hypothetical protein
MAKMRRFIRQLSASKTSEHFLPELKDVAFCLYVNRPCFDQVKTYLAKYNFVILAKV